MRLAAVLYGIGNRYNLLMYAVEGGVLMLVAFAVAGCESNNYVTGSLLGSWLCDWLSPPVLSIFE